TGAYLAWRVATLPSAPPVWLVALGILVEVGGFIGSGVLMWAMWHDSRMAPQHAETEPTLLDVAVRVDQHPVHQIRATMLSLQTLRSARHVVVDVGARPEVAALAAEFGAVYAATAVEACNGLRTCAAACETPVFLLLDAGDIPSAAAVDRLMPLMDDDRVAVAIGQSLMSDYASAEHGQTGLHELNFERQTLNPALGARGAAILSESGALIRRAAIDSVDAGDDARRAAHGRHCLV